MSLWYIFWAILFALFVLAISSDASKKTMQYIAQHASFSDQLQIAILLIKGITVFLIGGYLLYIWLPKNVYTPEDIEKEMTVDFNKERSAFLKSFAENWQQMVVSYKNNLNIMCFSNEEIEPTLFNALGGKNETAMETFTLKNNDVSHYFGISIRDIVRYELDWYKKYAKKCPPEKSLKQLVIKLRFRKEKLILTMRKKVFIPNTIYKNYDNIDYNAY